MVVTALNKEEEGIHQIWIQKIFRIYAKFKEKYRKEYCTFAKKGKIHMFTRVMQRMSAQRFENLTLVVTPEMEMQLLGDLVEGVFAFVANTFLYFCYHGVYLFKKYISFKHFFLKRKWSKQEIAYHMLINTHIFPKLNLKMSYIFPMVCL